MTRRLTLTCEHLAELTPGDLAGIAAGAADPLDLLTTLSPTRRTCIHDAVGPEAARNSLLCIPTTATDSFRAC